MPPLLLFTVHVPLSGVIMITTKSGKSGKTRVNYSGNVRFSDAIQIPDMVDSYTFAQYFNRANTNDGGGLVFDEAALERIKNYQTGKYTDPNTPEYYGAKAGNDGKMAKLYRFLRQHRLV